MADLLTLSSRIIDSGVAEDPAQPDHPGALEVADDIAVVESFSHVVVVRTDDGLVAFDASGVATGARRASRRSGVVGRAGQPRRLHPRPRRPRRRQRRVRRRRRRAAAASAPIVRRPRERAAPVRPLRADQRLEPADQPPPVRLAARATAGMGIGGGERALPARRRRAPDVTYRDELDRRRRRHGDPSCIHARGETDDHTWAWMPEQRVDRARRLLHLELPERRQPAEGAALPGASGPRALRAMAAHEPELLLPAHGLPIAGRERIARVLDDVATALEGLVARRAGDDERRRHARRDHPHGARRPTTLLACRTCGRCTTSPSSSSATCGAATAAGGTPTRRTSSRRRAPALAAELAALAGGADAARGAARWRSPTPATCAWPATSSSSPRPPAPDDAAVHAIRGRHLRTPPPEPRRH